MTTFFLLMTLHPEMQQRAQGEIENVVGKGVFPTINDKKDLYDGSHEGNVSFCSGCTIRYQLFPHVCPMVRNSHMV